MILATFLITILVATFMVVASKRSTLSHSGVRRLAWTVGGIAILAAGTTATAALAAGAGAGGAFAPFVVAASEQNPDRSSSGDAESQGAGEVKSDETQSVDVKSVEVKSDEAQSDEGKSDEAQPDKAQPDKAQPDDAQTANPDEKNADGASREPALGVEDDELRLRTFEPQFGGVVDLDKRPEWLKMDTKRVSEFQYSVSAGPYDDTHQCQIALLDELERATGDFINSYLGSQFASRFIHYDGTVIRDRLVAETYDETVHPTTGDLDMSMVHALVNYDDQFRAEITDRWQQWQATSRLAKGGLISGGVLLMLGILFSYFRIDTSTRGFYSGRLQFFTAVAILVLIAVGVLLARSSAMWLPF